jgi:hypothetical protein
MRRSVASDDSSDFRPAVVTAKHRVRRPPRCGVGSPSYERTNPFSSSRDKRLVDGAEREIASRKPYDLLVHRNTIRRFADPQDSEENDLFELSEHGRSFDRQCREYTPTAICAIAPAMIPY